MSVYEEIVKILTERFNLESVTISDEGLTVASNSENHEYESALALEILKRNDRNLPVFECGDLVFLIRPKDELSAEDVEKIREFVRKNFNL